MKIQSLAVIFAIIILPIVIILSFYIHKEIDTIALQTSYDTKLIDSTHDAMAALEINTANEDLSSVADSLRSIIEASTNVFFNTLATNLGISNAGNAAVDTYVPALLYTLYDGYYIYSPTRVPTVLTHDDKVIYVGDKGVTFEGTITYNQNGKSIKIGKYKFNSALYNGEKDPNIMSQLNGNGIGTEYGQMLFKNNGGDYYSVVIHNPSGGTENTEYKQDHILKSFMPYSARYKGKNTKNEDYDLTINYTLDNYISVEGNIGKVYYSKTGYLISNGTVVGGDGSETPGTTLTNPSDETVINDILTYNEITAENMILSGQYNINLTINPIVQGTQRVKDLGGSELVISYDTSELEFDGETLTYAKAKEKLKHLIENQNKDTTDNNGNEIADIIEEIQRLEYATEKLSAICYYVKAEIFSKWVYANLNTIKACDITDDIASLNEDIYTTDSKMDAFHKFKIYDEDGNLEYKDETIIFNSATNPELEDSPFYNHKMGVIRNNIQYNLNLAISSYNSMLQTLNMQLPVISDAEWAQILTRVSVTTFMQGLQCGMKVYNNYAIASSTNNELMTSPTQHYYVLKDQFNTADVTHEYHSLECDLLPDAEDGSKQYISFTTKDVKYDKIYDRETKLYAYDHRNLGCYRCAIPSNFEKNVTKDGTTDTVRGYKDEVDVMALLQSKRLAYYTAVASSRQDTYKTNALTDSNGYEIIFNDILNEVQSKKTGYGDIANDIGALNFEDDNSRSLCNKKLADGNRKMSEVREIEITLSNIYSENNSEGTVNFQLEVNDTPIDYNVVFNLKQVRPQTVVIPIHLDSIDTDCELKLKKIGLDDKVACYNLNVKVVYE